jgi:hypothetical protein
LLAACPKPFQPVAPEYEFWSKRGASQLDIKKALLECGMPSPDPTINMYEIYLGLKDDDAQLNEVLLEDACMENAGFRTRLYTVKQRCSWDRRKDLPACQPGVEIRAPSVERRLNRVYCKIKTDYQYCLQHAINPSACNPEGHKKPPPECLP